MTRNRIFLSALFLVLSTSLGAVQDKDDFKFSEWEAWDSVADGSWVKMEMVSDFGGTKTTMTMTTTRLSKKDDVITVETVMVMNKMKLPGQKRQIKKPKESDTAKKECPKCSKEHKSDVKTSKTKVKIGDKELACTLQEFTAYDCDGKEVSSGKIWYSKDVPGHMVRMETKMAQGTSKMNCLGFEKK